MFISFLQASLWNCSTRRAAKRGGPMMRSRQPIWRGRVSAGCETGKRENSQQAKWRWTNKQSDRKSSVGSFTTPPHVISQIWIHFLELEELVKTQTAQVTRILLYPAKEIPDIISSWKHWWKRGFYVAFFPHIAGDLRLLCICAASSHFTLIVPVCPHMWAR